VKLDSITQQLDIGAVWRYIARVPRAVVNERPLRVRQFAFGKAGRITGRDRPTAAVAAMNRLLNSSH
jgi:hypothetical protein